PDKDFVVGLVLFVTLGGGPPYEPAPVVRELREILVAVRAGQVHEHAAVRAVRPSAHEPRSAVAARLHPEHGRTVRCPGRLTRLPRREERQAGAFRLVHGSPGNPAVETEDPGKSPAQREYPSTPIG